MPIKLSAPCINLRSLTLFINFNDLNQISAALCVLRSSPNLQNLEIFVSTHLAQSIQCYLQRFNILFISLMMHTTFLFLIIHEYVTIPCRQRWTKQTALLTAYSYCWQDIFPEPAYSLYLSFQSQPIPIVVQHVTINFISGFKSEIYFIRFLLLDSRVLEKMIVKPLVNVRPELMDGLLRFRRGSPKAGVFYINE